MKFCGHNYRKVVFASLMASSFVFVSPLAYAKSVYISNQGFETSLRNWQTSGKVSTSSLSRIGDFSAKVSSEGSLLQRRIKVQKNTSYELSVYIRSAGTIGVEVAGNTSLNSRQEGTGWKKTVLEFNSGDNDVVTILALYNEKVGYFDEFKLKTLTPSAPTAQTDSNVTSKTSLDASLPPSGNFDLLDWKLSVPTDNDGNGKADNILETELSNGYSDSRFFYTHSDGGMVFKAPVKGATTSKNTKYTRVELREMLRRGDTEYSTTGVGPNNWVFSSAPQEDRRNAGAIDGNLTGTVAINHVTTTGSEKQVGRVVFAQIHAEQDEPIRFYYRKLPNHTKGAIYFAHEPLNKSDIYFEMVGSRSSAAQDPVDGIALGEKFSYEIDVNGNTMTVKLFREGKNTITEVVDMSESDFDIGGDYMYFKAGAYLQDRTGNPDDYAEVVYYALDNKH